MGLNPPRCLALFILLLILLPLPFDEVSSRCTREQEYEEDSKAEGATHFWHPGNVCGPVGGPYRPAEPGRTEAAAPAGSETMM